MTTEPLNPVVEPLFDSRYAENTSGIIAGIVACINALGGSVTSYPSNTAGIIQALIDLHAALQASSLGPRYFKREFTAGEAIPIHAVVYVGSDGLAYKADNATNAGKATVLGVAQAAAAAGLTVTVIMQGMVETFSGLTTSAEYYLTLDGGLTTTAPTGGGFYLVTIGQAVSPTVLYVDPQLPVLLT